MPEPKDPGRVVLVVDGHPAFRFERLLEQTAARCAAEAEQHLPSLEAPRPNRKQRRAALRRKRLT